MKAIKTKRYKTCRFVTTLPSWKLSFLCSLFFHCCLWVIQLGALLPRILASPLSDGPWGPTDPVADPSAIIVVSGPNGAFIRFTVLTDRMIRVEQSSSRIDLTSAGDHNGGKESSIFEDRKTVAVINRKLPVPSFQQSESNEGFLTLQTRCLTLTYQVGEALSFDSFKMTGRMYCSSGSVAEDTKPTSPYWKYNYGEQDPHNLLGTIRTLDFQDAISLNCTQRNAISDHCEWGLISRSGFAIVNDTANYALSDGRDWWDGPNRNSEDIYILGHGHDYEGALSDYRLIGGFIPLIPRYALGIWYSRWYDYTAASAAQIVKRYEEFALPLDVFVFDMNWHTKNDWTGYSWDKRLYGSPEDAVAYMKFRGIAVTLNLHDANGVNPWEDRYEDMCHIVGCVQGDSIPFSITNETIAYGLEDGVLQSLENNGVDFWWIDWQQGEIDRGGAAGSKQNPTIWTAHIRSTNANRRRKKIKGKVQRSMVLARWGGLGAHRYPVHFSGDVAHLTWENLEYQPYFSMTATNVGAIWSHDIEGPSNEPELYTRWLQWGVVSGVVRTHDRGMSAGECAVSHTCSVVEPWDAPPKFAQANFAAMRLRGKLIPYLYSAAYYAHKNGRWFTIPMYYKWPELEGAYETARPRLHNIQARYGPQYMLGDDIWVAPVVKPSNATTQLVELNLWIPPGKWIGVVGGQVVNGPANRTWMADLNDIPMFARAGSIVPTIPVKPGSTVGLAMKPYEELVWTIYLASGGPISGSGLVYEDDGSSTDHLSRSCFTITTATYNLTNPTENRDRSNNFGGEYSVKRRLKTSPFTASSTLEFSLVTSGRCEELPKTRATTLRLVNALPPSSVVANGRVIPHSRFGTVGCWSFDSNDAAVVVKLPHTDIAAGIDVVIETAVNMKDRSIESVLEGIGFQIQRAITAKSALDEVRMAPGSQEGQDKLPGKLLLAASLGASLEVAAGFAERETFDTILKSYQAHFDGAQKEVQELDTLTTSPRVTRALRLLESAQHHTVD